MTIEIVVRQNISEIEKHFLYIWSDMHFDAKNKTTFLIKRFLLYTEFF